MKKRLILILLLLVTFGLFGCGEKPSEVEPVEEEMGITIHTILQDEYLSGDYKKIASYATGDKELSYPFAVNFNLSGVNENETGDKYIVVIYNDNERYEYRTNKNYIDIYNFKAHTNYSWEINGVKQDDFVTKSGLRNLYIDGITNVRDIGGYKIEGGYTRQGMLIRSSKLTDDATGEVLITEKGIEELKRLGIKTELDLRTTSLEDDGTTEQGGITASVVDGVNYISFPMKSGGNYLQLNRDVLKDLFKILADEDNYPILFHCSIGTDRTGVIAFLVNALLGVSKEDIYKDYLFSNFGLIYSMRTPSTINDYINKVTTSSKLSLKENVTKYLIDLGVDEADINKVIEIMTERI